VLSSVFYSTASAADFLGTLLGFAGSTSFFCPFAEFSPSDLADDVDLLEAFFAFLVVLVPYFYLFCSSKSS